MGAIFLNSDISKTSDPRRLLLNLSDNINVNKEVMIMLLYQTLAFTIHGKI